MDADNTPTRRQYRGEEIKQPPLSNDELKLWRQMASWFQSGKAIIRFCGWLFVAVGAVVAVLGGVMNIMHQNGGGSH